MNITNNKIYQVACTLHTSFILTLDGAVFSSGFNGHGETGQGHRDFWHDAGVADSIHQSFGRVFSFNGLKDVRVKRVIPGHFHCFAILEDNSLYGWGLNNNYQLGLSEENTIDGIHRDHYVTPILIDTDVDDVFAGEYNSAVKKLDGSIYAMGYNKTGVIAMFGAIVVLFLVPFINQSEVRSSTFRPIYRKLFWFLFADFLILGWIGQKLLNHLTLKLVSWLQFCISYFSVFFYRV